MSNISASATPGAPRATSAGAAVALMYHALEDDGNTPEGQDPHYTLSRAAFAAHLAAVAQAGGGASARDWLRSASTPALLTFDDGHLSNYRIALPMLLESGMTADFFVNPVNVGQPGFANWTQLREMADAGMSIQSHGHEHVYLTSYGPAALRDNLLGSRKAIEDAIGQAVTLLAPPGGRMPARLGDVARECGYERVLSSRPGRISPRGNGMVLPRMSVTATTSGQQLHGWLMAGRRGVLREQLRYGLLASAKRLLGDSRYERLRYRALADRGE